MCSNLTEYTHRCIRIYTYIYVYIIYRYNAQIQNSIRGPQANVRLQCCLTILAPRSELMYEIIVTLLRSLPSCYFRDYTPWTKYQLIENEVVNFLHNWLSMDVSLTACFHQQVL